MLDLTKTIQYKIDDKSSYKLLHIKINEIKIYEEDKEVIKSFINKVSGDKDNIYKLLLEFPCFENIDLENIRNMLDLHGNKCRSYISNNINSIVCIIPNTIIINTVRLYLYFNEFNLPIKLVANITDALDIID